ncbi:helix-turn-helix domain-containing protein [Sphingomonas sp. So64.6b]|nr:helix-turn-helix domain-containing protein [Sphingomonas sp. So64.6b]
MQPPSVPKRVLLLAFEGINLLDLAGPLQAFEASEPHRMAPERYETVVASLAGGDIQTSTRLPIGTRKLSDLESGSFDTIMVGGGGANGRPIVVPLLVDWLRNNVGTTDRICSICAGAFVLAAAGLLDGRRATTHWHWTALLQRENPSVDVQADSIYTHDGKIWTSAGVTAGIDLTLALIEQDHGHQVAIQAARRLVVFMKRPGGQAQFSAPLMLQSRSNKRFSDLHAWMRQNLADDLRIDRLAEVASMSERNFNRLYVASVGETPARSVEAMRFEAACGFLELSSLPLKTIASAAGLGNEQNLRRLFARRAGVTPAEYRLRFGKAGPS